MVGLDDLRGLSQPMILWFYEKSLSCQIVLPLRKKELALLTNSQL